MDFELTAEHKMIQKMVREFAEREIKPVIAELEAKEQFPAEIMRKMGELGLLGIVIPPEYGGAGADRISFALAVEEIARASGSVAISYVGHTSLCLAHIYNYGNDEQRKKYVLPLARGEKIGAWGTTEPKAGSDIQSIKTIAKPDGDEWVINGTKYLVTNGHVADVIVITAKTAPEEQRSYKGISAFIIEKDAPGFKLGRVEDKLGLRASVTSELIFENCRIPKENLLGELNNAFKNVMKVLDAGRISIASMALGIGSAALEAAIEYAKQRIQFGKPIAEFQAIQQMLVDIATELECARWLTLKSAWLADQGLPFTREVSEAKLYAAETAMKATIKAVQIFGGYGYTTEYPVERYMRDAKLCAMGQGTSEIQRLIIARRLGLT